MGLNLNKLQYLNKQNIQLIQNLDVKMLFRLTTLLFAFCLVLRVAADDEPGKAWEQCGG